MKDSPFLVIAVTLLAVLGLGVYFSADSDVSVTASPTGSTFSSPRMTAVRVDQSSGSATSTSILNTDANDRYITGGFSYCTGIGTSNVAYTGGGLAKLLFRAATTSTAISGNLVDANANYALNLDIATSSPVGYTSTSTEGVIAGYSRIWPTGTYLTFQPNATNTAVCTHGVNYLPG